MALALELKKTRTELLAKSTRAELAFFYAYQDLRAEAEKKEMERAKRMARAKGY